VDELDVRAVTQCEVWIGLIDFVVFALLDDAFSTKG